MRSGQAGRGRGGSLGGREQAQDTSQADLDLVLPPGAGAAATAGGGGGGATRGGKRSGEIGAPASFLDKLCAILNEPRLSEHISWNQEGDGVVINQPDQFAKAVLPKYYKHSNYQSFVRQLNIYGFHKTRHDEDSCEFKQPNFKRGEPHLVGLIRRKGGQGNNNAAAAGGRHPESNNGNNVAVEETKGMMDRVAAELRAVCNRVVHLEAEIGMIKHRHNHLRLECQALLRVVMLEGGQPLAGRAVAALRQLPHVGIEAEMSELLPIRSRPEEQRQPHQHQKHHQRSPGSSAPPFQDSSSSSSGNGGLVASGADAGFSAVAAAAAAAAGLGARSGEEANPPFSASGAALASVVAAAIASHPPPQGLARADRTAARGNNDGQVRLVDGVGQQEAVAASPAPGGFPLAFWPQAAEEEEPRGGASRAGGSGGDSVPGGLSPMMPAAASPPAPSVYFGADGSRSNSSGGSSSRGFASNAGGAEGVPRDTLEGVPSSSLFSDRGISDGKSAPTADDAAAAAPAVAAAPPLLADFSVHRGGSEGATTVSVTSGDGAGGREQAEAWHAGAGRGAEGGRGDGQEERGDQQGEDLEAMTRNKRKADGAVE